MHLTRYLAALFLVMSSLTITAADEDHIKDMKVDDANGVITIFMDSAFGNQEFTEKSVKKIYKRTRKELRKALPRECRNYDVVIITNGAAIESLIGKGPVSPSVNEETPFVRQQKTHHGGWWDTMAYTGQPWVRNISRPLQPDGALSNKHIALWASHGRFYDLSRECWRWQRPKMFCTAEDLFTQTIVVPYLIPMLEHAGAYVFTPRERDWQTEEVIVDNDSPYYSETIHQWSDASVNGFAMPKGMMSDGENPFDNGTVRQVATCRKGDAPTAVYQPYFKHEGRYAVYVSYATVEGSIDEVLYSVYHKGQRTDFTVNQQMGGGTWVYLGTFDFDQGESEGNRVVVSSASPQKGIITTDAVRFGGGMGNIERGGTISGMPRCLEGARYYAQWAGAPYEVYSVYQGTDDYKDDINVRSLMTNWLGGGSPYMPNKEGKHVPIDLSLAIHSDAGYNPGMKGIYGSLAICTTDYNDGMLDAGISRSRSRELCEDLLSQAKKDITAEYGTWVWRDLYDRNYSESRMPGVPSAIFEILSHQSFPDMKLGHDPNFKFTLARSIYKTILRYEAKAHGEEAIVQPLPPKDFHIDIDTLGYAILSWSSQKDAQEPTARPTSYIIYKSTPNGGYDNGTVVPANTNHATTTVRVPLTEGTAFRITAANRGGESLPSEELFAHFHGKHAPTVMIVNAFQRLAGPAVVDSTNAIGFDISSDPGVSYGLTAGWCGKQQVFNTATMGQEGAGTFSYSGNELAGHFIAGNTFDYVTEHAKAIMTAGKYNIVSASREAVEDGRADISRCALLDIILGNERCDGYSLRQYKTFTPALQKRLRNYAARHGALLVSGSYIASDMLQPSEQEFLASVLHCASDTIINIGNEKIKGLGTQFDIISTLNPEHYATTQSDCLALPPALPSAAHRPFAAMQYANGRTAAIAYSGPAATFAMGFPFECIKSPSVQASIMRGILAFLIK